MNPSSPTYSATAFGAFLVGLTARVVAITASVLPAGSGLVLEKLAVPKTRGHEPLVNWSRELRLRVSSTLRSLGIEPDFSIGFDMLPPTSARLDLAALAACLGALGRIGADALGSTIFAGELALDGRARPVRGVLPMLRAAGRDRKPPKPWRDDVQWPAGDVEWRFVVPKSTAEEASRAGPLYVFAVESAHELANDAGFPFGMQAMPPPRPWTPAAPSSELSTNAARLGPRVLRALEIAAAGGHGVLLVGPERQRMFAAKLLHGLLPSMTESEAVETTELHSIAGMLDARTARDGLVAGRPFRAPHHTCSPEGLVGGGEPMRPGEASLAHNGILFLDAASDFGSSALERLGAILRHGDVKIVRGAERATFPAGPANLVLGLTPCLCEPNGELGRLAPDHHERVCTPERITRDRERALKHLGSLVDMTIVLDSDDPQTEKANTNDVGMFAKARTRVEATDAFAWKRPIDEAAGLPRAERIARTIADLAGREHINGADREEAEALAL
jgi:magnesium chelatase family protein